MISAIYARKSTEQNGVSEEAWSVARHEDAKAYASLKGWTVAELPFPAAQPRPFLGIWLVRHWAAC